MGRNVALSVKYNVLNAGIFVLSSLRLKYIAYDSVGRVHDSDIAEFHNHIQPYFESMYSCSLKSASREAS